MGEETPVHERAEPRRVSKTSLRTRLTLWVVAIFSLIHFATTGVYWLYHSEAVSRDFDERLVERSLDIADQIRKDVPGIDGLMLELIANRAVHATRFGNITVGVFDAEGGSVVQRPSLARPPPGLDWAGALRSGEPVLTHLGVGVLERPDPVSRSARAVARSFRGRDDREYVLLVIMGDAFAYKQRAAAGQTLLLAALVGLIAAGIAGWFIAGIAVAPFDRLRALAKHLRPESLGEEIRMGPASAEVAALTRELEDVRARLAKAFSAQERFLSNVTHEIKTPIAVLLVEAQTLATENLTAAGAEFVASVEHEMSRLGKLIEAFLMLTRVRDSKAMVGSLRCRANDLAMDSVEDCQLMASQHRVRLLTHLLDDDLVDTEVRGDQDLLTTMLNNLIRNAIRFSDPGQAVDLSLGVQDGLLTMAVSDEGPGIPPERISTIFDRFSQTPEGQRRGRGHGLGLAIAQGIAELHGGLISVRNRDEGGCVFAVSLPVSEPILPDHRPPSMDGAARHVSESAG